MVDGSPSRSRWLAEAERVVTELVAHDPAYTVDVVQPAYRGGTNCVTFGSRDGERVVFKYFVSERRWQNEDFCLQHFAATGHVPRIVEAVPPRLLVLSHLLGHDLDVAGLTEAELRLLSREIGQALADLVRTPLPRAADGRSPVHDFDLLPWGEDLRAVLEGYLGKCRRIQRGIPAFRDPFCARSLALLETQLPVINGQRRVLFHEDISNMRVEGARFRGFYDLEMCRLGTESMQLGVVLGLCAQDNLDWPALLAGFESRTGRRHVDEDVMSILAMQHLYHWIRICRWGEWDGDPDAADLRRASEADAAWHQQKMREACLVLRRTAPVAAWFGATAGRGW
jgi:hypothetical protein